MTLFFIIGLILYYFIAFEICIWETNFRLGSLLKCPSFFIEHHHYYIWFSYLCFITILIIAFYTKYKVLAIISVLLIAFFTAVRGREAAILLFKSEFGIFLLEENETEEALKLSLMTDVEILKKYGKTRIL